MASDPHKENEELQMRVIELEEQVRKLQITADANERNREEFIQEVREAQKQATSEALAAITASHQAEVAHLQQLMASNRVRTAEATDRLEEETAVIQLYQRLEPFMRMNSREGVDLAFFWRTFGVEEHAPWRITAAQLELLLSRDERVQYQWKAPRDAPAGFFELVLSQLPRLEKCVLHGGGYTFDAELLGLVPMPFMNLMQLIVQGPEVSREDVEQLGLILRGCARLEHLTLSGCSSVFDASSFGDLTQLTKIELKHLPIHSIDFLSSCTMLTEVAVEHCHHVSDFAVLAKLPRLTSISLSGSVAMSSIDWITQCPRVEELNIGDCRRVGDLAPLADLQHLRKVVAYGTSITDLSTWVPARASTLQELNISFCSHLTSATLEHLGELTELRKLSLGSLEQVVDLTWIRRCPHMEEVYVGECSNLVDLRDVAALPQLRRLFANGLIGVKDLSCLAQVRGTLEELFLGDCSSVDDFSVLRQLTHLTKLYVYGTCFPSVEIITSCDRLNELSLANCPKVQDLNLLPNLKFLKKLFMGGITLPEMGWLSACSYLEEVWLEGVQPAPDRKAVDGLAKLQRRGVVVHS